MAISSAYSCLIAVQAHTFDLCSWRQLVMQPELRVLFRSSAWSSWVTTIYARNLHRCPVQLEWVTVVLRLQRQFKKRPPLRTVGTVKSSRRVIADHRHRDLCAQLGVPFFDVSGETNPVFKRLEAGAMPLNQRAGSVVVDAVYHLMGGGRWV